MKRIFYLHLLSILLGVVLLLSQSAPQAQASLPTSRRVNLPFNMPTNQAAIFWFGQVNYTNNYANVRLTYNEKELLVWVQTIDTYLWFDPTPEATEELSKWDAVSLYLNLGGNAGDVPTGNAYRFVAQFSPPNRVRDDYELAFRGNGVGWSIAPLAFMTETGYRGSGYNNGATAKGWWVKLSIPYTSLGLTKQPDPGNIWGLSVAIHDRDDAVGTAIPNQIWPETASDMQPATWGQLNFGLPSYAPPPAKLPNTIVIRHGVNGNTVVDGEVGGHTTCGNPLTTWTAWGQANYAGYHQINVQNQWDVSDFPCYSRYYINFPLDDIPAGKVILSAKLTLFQFGNSGQTAQPGPVPSYLQIFTVDEPWNEAEINWNNAPLASQNWTGAWVNPLPLGSKWPGVPREWDVSGAVAKAYAAGGSLNLAVYSADTAQHSGRYFYSSDAGEEGRPLLKITYGTSSR